MKIDFTDVKMRMCLDEYNRLNPEERISMSHFDLAEVTNIDDTDQWLAFLRDPRVADMIQEELSVYKAAQQRKLIQRATTHDKSVGTAQMISALGKSMETDNDKSGAIFVYSYVPLNAHDANSPQARTLDNDVFER